MMQIHGDYAWVKNGECEFDVASFNMARSRRGSEFLDSSPIKQKFAWAASQNEPIGIMLLPRGSGVAPMKEMAAVAIAIGRNGLAPSIRHLYFVTPPDHETKFDLRRKLLAYHPGNIVLVDQEFWGESLFSEDEFMFSGGKFRIAERFFEVSDNAYSRAASMCAALHAEERFVHAVTGKCDWTWDSFANDIPSTPEALDVAVAEFVEHRNSQTSEARELYRSLSAHVLGIPAVRDVTGEDIRTALAGNPDDNGFCKWSNGWGNGWSGWNARSSSKRKKGWHSVADFGNENAELSDRIYQMYMLPDTVEYVTQVQRETERAERLREIWEKVLNDNECPVVLPASLSRPHATDKQRKMTDEVLTFIAKAYGIDVMIGAWVSGVPLDDVFA